MRNTLRVVLVLLCAIPAMAQMRTVTGRATSIEDGTSLPGVNVIVKGTSNGTTTDADGRFTISVPDSEATLVFSFIGLKTSEVSVGDRTIVDVQLEPDVTQLTEVVVLGYGDPTPKREMTGAIGQIGGKEIENLPMQSFDRAMQGRTAGVLVQSASGVPGGPVRIRVRGTGSITAGNEPLYIVDGIQLNSTNNASFTQSNPLAFLNPNDIESIEVLKDPATAAIYGAQAGNGVVLVTTKRGKSGATRFNFNYYRGITEPLPILDVMNAQQMTWARIEAVTNAGGTRATALQQLGLPTTLTDAQIDSLPTYNWQEAAFRDGIVDNYELSLNGGNDKTTYYASASYNRQDANVIGMDFKRGTGKFTVSHKANDRLSFDQTINLSTITQDGNLGSAGPSGSFGAPQYSSSMILPHLPIYNEDGSFNAPAGGLPGALPQNVIQVVTYNRVMSVTNQAVGNFSVNYNIRKNLQFRSFYGVDYRVIKGDLYYDPRTPDGASRRGFAQAQNDYNTNFITNQTFNYSTTIGADHSISALAGAEYRSEVREGYTMSAEGFPTYQFYTIQSAATPTANSSFWTSFRRAGVFGKVSYDFKKKYFINATLRYDGSSRFGANNKFGFFPSVAGGWIASEESFFADNLSFINFFKIRASYGETGNDQIGNFDSRGLYGGEGNYNGLPGIRPSGIANPDLKWERNISVNIGLDYGIFENRINGSVDFFKRTSSDLLLNRPLPYGTGYASITSNLGEVENKGVEIGINTVNVKTNNFSWSTSFNITFIDNKVTKLFDGLNVLPGNQSVRVGHALNANFTRIYAGVNPATGRPMWLDSLGNVTYNPVSPRDLRVVGDDFVDTYGGFTNTLSYKGLELTAFFQYEYGRQALNTQRMFLSQLAQTVRNGESYFFENRWTTPGQITSVPRPYDTGSEPQGISQTTASTRYYEDASYIRLKQLTLAYNIPVNLISRLKLSSARIYAQGTNLLTWTEWKGYDPEWYSTDPNNLTNQGNIPQTKSYTFGVQLGL